MNKDNTHSNKYQHNGMSVMGRCVHRMKRASQREWLFLAEDCKEGILILVI